MTASAEILDIDVYLPKERVLKVNGVGYPARSPENLTIPEYLAYQMLEKEETEGMDETASTELTMRRIAMLTRGKLTVDIMREEMAREGTNITPVNLLRIYRWVITGKADMPGEAEATAAAEPGNATAVQPATPNPSE